MQAYDGVLLIFLGPASDQRHHWELSLGTPRFPIPAGLLGAAVADNERLSTGLQQLEGRMEGPPSARCIAHLWGAGVNVLIENGKCVSGLADKGAQQWIRIDNTLDRPRVVAIKYDPLP